MIPAYDETYLPDAMANLAGAFDYALNDCGLPVGLFMDFFATSEAAALFGRGTPKYVCGMSGEELVAAERASWMHSCRASSRPTMLEKV